jgi:hypothetical protein
MSDRKTDTMEDDAFDLALAELLAQSPADSAPLSRAVLSRLAAPPRAPLERWGTEVLAHPGALISGYGAMLLLMAALGYAALPRIGGEDLLALIALGDLLPLLGGM